MGKKKAKNSGRILILDKTMRFYLEDAGHLVENCAEVSERAVVEKLLKGNYDFIIILDDRSADEKIQAVPEERRSQIILVSPFGDPSLSRKEACGKLGVLNFVRLDGVVEMVNKFLVEKEKREENEQARQEKK